MRSWRLSVLALCLSCTDYVPGVADDLSVVPSSGSTGADTTIQIRGQLVLTRLRVDYAQPESVDPIARIKVWLRPAGTQELGEALLPISLSAENHVETLVPAGLVPGLYDVVVEDAYERERIIEKAFTVIGVECSDGLQRGEPCGEGCTVIVGCECRAEDQCAPICGDGLIKGDERCDDANDAPGDGCDGECRVEAGFSCQGEPSVCTTGCGDGVTAGSEACDDSNQVLGDGCTTECVVEVGWSCTGGRCTTICGDGMLLGDELCEPELQGIGCGPSCRPRPGFECTLKNDGNERVICRPTCGDGEVVGDEACDDDNLQPGDGCFGCRVEEGWRCDEAQPSICNSICGDGRVVGHEECDPGTSPNIPDAIRRACGPDCRAAPGYWCEDGQCAPIECTSGQSCDDGSACTHDDVCRANGLCRGLPKYGCFGFCATGCSVDQSTVNVTCCEDTCGTEGQCPDCQASPSSSAPICSYACQGDECRAHCKAGSTCNVDYSPSPGVLGGGGRVDCDAGAVCGMSCDGSRPVNGEQTVCVMNCAEGSICLIENCAEAYCELNCADQSQMECQTPQGLVKVCGRSCPS